MKVIWIKDEDHKEIMGQVYEIKFKTGNYKYSVKDYVSYMLKATREPNNKPNDKA